MNNNQAEEHPLDEAIENTPPTNQALDIELQSSSLLDNSGRPNISRDSSYSQSAGRDLPLQEKEISHSMGLYNAADHPEVVDLTTNLTGRFPEWLTGEHFTIGPGTYDVKYTRKIEVDGHLQSATAEFKFGHWFDGLPLVNRFNFNGKENTLKFSNRLTSRRLIEKIRDRHGYAPCHPAGLFKTDSNQTVLIKFIKAAAKAKKPDGEPCGARVLPSIPGIDGRLFCLNMANHIQELDPTSLEPQRVLCWDEVNPEFKGYSACPNGHIDRHTEEYINFTMHIGYRKTTYTFFATSKKDPKGSVIATVDDAPTGYVNSFAVTQNYIVLVIYPLLANTSAVKFAWNESIMDAFTFQPNQPTLFYVISRKEGKVVANYRAAPCFAFHHVNAFEDEQGQICVDIVCYPNDAIAHQLTVENLRNPASMDPARLATSEVRRYRLNYITRAEEAYQLNNGYLPTVTSVTARLANMWGYVRSSSADTATESRIEDTNPWYEWMPIVEYQKLVDTLSVELPQVNPNFAMQKYTYMYGLGFSAENALKDGSIWDSIIKANVDTNKIDAWWHESGCFPSEAVFVPRPKTASEDDGVLLSVVLDASRGTSFLLVLNAADLEEITRADLGQIVPLSFARGAFKPSREL